MLRKGCKAKHSQPSLLKQLYCSSSGVQTLHQGAAPLQQAKQSCSRAAAPSRSGRAGACPHRADAFKSTLGEQFVSCVDHAPSSQVQTYRTIQSYACVCQRGLPARPLGRGMGCQPHKMPRLGAASPYKQAPRQPTPTTMISAYLKYILREEPA